MNTIDEIEKVLDLIITYNKKIPGDREGAMRQHREAKAAILAIVESARNEEEILTLQWVMTQLSFDGSTQDIKYIEDRIAELKSQDGAKE